MKSELSRQRANALQGYQVYSSDDPPQQKQEEDEHKEEQEDEDKATALNKLRAMLYDMGASLQFSNAEKGV